MTTETEIAPETRCRSHHYMRTSFHPFCDNGMCNDPFRFQWRWTPFAGPLPQNLPELLGGVRAATVRRNPAPFGLVGNWLTGMPNSQGKEISILNETWVYMF